MGRRAVVGRSGSLEGRVGLHVTALLSGLTTEGKEDGWGTRGDGKVKREEFERENNENDACDVVLSEVKTRTDGHDTVH